MESVRYLIRMRDANKAAREAREKEAREKLGLPPVVSIPLTVRYFTIFFIVKVVVVTVF